jgi:transcriptional regulator of acetoin/glycerol metabolism
LRVTHLRALRDKYEQMLRLRQLHARAKAEPDFVEPDPRASMAALARQWPGALRELDELPLESIEARIAELALAERDPSCATPWMKAQAEFHRLARGALAVKRWLAGRALTPELEAAFAAALLAMPEREREDASEWEHDLAAVANPPRGRVMDLVYVKVARELGVDVRTARAAALPPRRRAASLRRRAGA